MLDTKWRKFKYSGFTKAIVSLMILIGGTVFIWCILWFMVYGNRVEADFADGYEYSEAFYRRVHNVAELNTTLKSIENINLTAEDDVTRVQLYERYNKVKSNINDTPNFIYIVKDLKTGQVVDTNTGMSSNWLMSQKNAVRFSEDIIKIQFGSNDFTYELADYLGYVNSYDSRYYGSDILEFLSEEDYEIYAAVLDDAKVDDLFSQLTKTSSGAQLMVRRWQYMLMFSSVIFATGLILMAFMCGNKAKDEQVHVNKFDRIYTELQLAAFLGILSIPLIIADHLRYGREIVEMNTDISLQFGLASFLLTMMGLVFYCSLVRQIKGGILFKSSLMGVLIRRLKWCVDCLHGLRFTRPFWILFFIAYGLVHLFIGAAIYDGFVVIILVILTNIFFGTLLLKHIRALRMIMDATQKVSQGELDEVLDTSKFPKMFVEFYDNIYHVQSGMRRAIQEAVKGERMKAELITNVSHDLKTPLTSIISYVDLLSKEPLGSDDAKQYVDVLINKSDTLKRLIDDLIEASKVSSGNLKMTCTTIGLNELVQQCVGECQQRFEEKGLDVRITESDAVKVLADGKSMWRVMENLFDNISKYALPNSRVYLQLSKSQDKGMIILKNISENPLEIAPEELIERFVRGSESRTTDGSGLGLSIAEGLVNNQGGSFEIEIDGDLFKTIIQMPLSHEEIGRDEDLD